LHDAHWPNKQFRMSSPTPRDKVSMLVIWK